MAKQKFTTSIEETVLKQVKIQAINENTTVSELLERIAKNYLESLKISSTSSDH